jgi:rod shape-determining protein MreD
VRALKVAAALLAALLVHVLGAWALPDLPRYLDLFLVVAVVNALDGRSAAGLAGGLAAGLTRDVLSGRLYGLHGFADTIAGYAVARAAQRLDIRGPGAVLVTAGLATLLQQVVLLALAYLFTVPEPPEPFPVLVRSVANGTVAAAVWTLSTRWRRVRETVQRKRTSKIRL